MHTDRQKRRILWCRVGFRYGWSILARELEASPRWSATDKVRTGVLLGIVISVPVTFGTLIPYVYWLLTGRGPWTRYGFSSAIVVNPFVHRTPPEIRAAMAEFQAARTGDE